jgi:hypothetical protein
MNKKYNKIIAQINPSSPTASLGTSIKLLILVV